MVFITIVTPLDLSIRLGKQIQCPRSRAFSCDYITKPCQWGVNSSEYALALIQSLCLANVESVEHVFEDCMMVQKVWEAVDRYCWLLLTISPLGCHNRPQFLGRVQQSHNSLLKQKFSFLLWSIWKSRNAIVHMNEASNPLLV